MNVDQEDINAVLEEYINLPKVSRVVGYDIFSGFFNALQAFAVCISN